MINKILLLHPRHEKTLETKSRTSFNFPFGLGYLASIMEKNNYKVEALDAHAEQLTKEETIRELEKRDFDILGISAFSTQYNAVKIISGYVKDKLGKKIIVGGPLATYTYELTLKKCHVDVCVLGEAENTIIELLNYLAEGGGLENVKGIAFKKGDEVIKTPDREYIKNLDDLPRPAYHLFKMEKYLRANIYEIKFAEGSRGKDYAQKKIMAFVTSRGCPYSCRFCSRNYKGVRHMSVDRIIEQIKYFKGNYDVDAVHFCDELFVFSKERMKEFVEKLKPLNLTWDAQARINLVDYEMLKMMKEGGCTGIGFGIESGSQKILNNMDKKITVEQIEKAMGMAKNLDLGVKAQLIFGYPGEDESTVQETIDLFKKIDYPGRRFSLITPIPGSPLYDECKEKGLIKDEEQYLIDIEKSFGLGKVMINFTKWSDDELLKKMRETYETMKKNYFKKSLARYVKYKANNLRKFIKGKYNGLLYRIERLKFSMSKSKAS